ncbi:MAG: AI-2E family transporter [Bacteroidales bacterium]|nr:AI-2E family transporter [Bacteroidales bacterium]MCF6342089.1 AI-2E family transporter [Bacteroidales bacterium]
MSEVKMPGDTGNIHNSQEQIREDAQVQQSIRTALRLGFIALLFVMSYFILKPFLGIVIWGIIIAVALFPVHKKLAKMLGNREKLSVTLIVLAGIALIVVPSIMFTASTVESLQELSKSLEEGSLQIPKPEESVADWPIVGGIVYETWELASNGLGSLVQKYTSQLMEFAPKVFSFAAGLVGTVFIFIISLVISGALLVNSKAAEKTAISVFKTLAGAEGEQFASLAGATIRSVVQGVLGTALIQTFFLSIGLFSIGFPGAGIVVLIVLFVAIIQLPLLLVMLPAIIYVFTYAGTISAVIFTVWTILWSASDNIIKPLLMGRGMDIPMLVILLGAIGGMMLAGIVGLFIGAVLLAFSYKVFQAIIQAD